MLGFKFIQKKSFKTFYDSVRADTSYKTDIVALRLADNEQLIKAVAKCNNVNEKFVIACAISYSNGDTRRNPFTGMPLIPGQTFDGVVYKYSKEYKNEIEYLKQLPRDNARKIISIFKAL